MKIPVRCDSCQHWFGAPPEMAGRTLTCPNCKQPIVVPNSHGNPAGVAQQPEVMPQGPAPFGMGNPPVPSDWADGIPSYGPQLPGYGPQAGYAPWQSLGPQGYGMPPGYGPPRGPMMGHPYGMPGQAMPGNRRPQLVWLVAGGAGAVVLVLVLFMLFGRSGNNQRPDPIADAGTAETETSAKPPSPNPEQPDPSQPASDKTTSGTSSNARSSDRSWRTLLPGQSTSQTVRDSNQPSSPTKPQEPPDDPTKPKWQASIDGGPTVKFPDRISINFPKVPNRISHQVNPNPYIWVIEGFGRDRVSQVVDLRTGEARPFTIKNPELIQETGSLLAVRACPKS